MGAGFVTNATLQNQFNTGTGIYTPNFTTEGGQQIYMPSGD